MLASFLQRLDSWIANEYRLPAGALGIFRVFYAGYILFVVGPPQFRWIAHQPSFFFDPPTYSLANLADHLPSIYFFFVLDLLVVGLLVLLLFGFRARIISLLLGATLVVGFSFYHSFGKINHDTIMIVVTPLLMAFSGWGSYYSVNLAGPQCGSAEEIYWPVTTLALILGFAMFSAGFPKLFSDGSFQNAWLDTYTQAVKGYAITHHHSDLAGDLLAPIMLERGEDFWWEALDYTAVIFEVGFLLAVLSSVWFRFFIIVAVFFHFMNGLLLSISFVNNIALYLLFIDWTPIVAWFEKLAIKFISPFTMVVSTLGLLIAHTLHLPANVIALLNVLGATDLFASLLVAGVACLFFSFNFFRSFSRQSPTVNG